MDTLSRRRELSLDDAHHMLTTIPADDRDVWVKLAMALKSEFGDSAYGIWDAWSQTAENYQERAARDVWRSIKDGPVGIATLVHLAREHGWRPDAPIRHAKAPQRPVEPPKAAPSTKAYALELWLKADRTSEAVKTHPYAVAKGIDWHAGAGRVKASGRVIGREADCLVVPIRENATGRVQGVQAINPDGAKQTFGQITGGCLVLGNTLDKRIEWYVCEGWASAVSVVFHHRKGNAVCGVAFGKSNMQATAELLDRVFDPECITILEER